ncbi:hypothetical protein L2E82_36420 [Cichorium intybus]|uniref:Uncharacterized protein n=1 Tax=Cichorium intybus TaxID=13427 RepID=A0ACB9BRF4_CICIN|nr:hypothetical protein L2E82_36420 [Cichorium intybus]
MPAGIAVVSVRGIDDLKIEIRRLCCLIGRGIKSVCGSSAQVMVVVADHGSTDEGGGTKRVALKRVREQGDGRHRQACEGLRLCAIFGYPGCALVMQCCRYGVVMVFEVVVAVRVMVTLREREAGDVV